MDVICIKVTIGKKDNRTGLEFDFFKIKTDSTQDILTAVTSNRPALYVVPQNDVSHILEMDAVFDGRGKKNDSKGLTWYLEKSNDRKIPVLIGDYSKIEHRTDTDQYDLEEKPLRIGTALNSFQVLLTNWGTQKRQANSYNAFILGLDENLLKAIFIKYGKDSERRYIDELQNKIYDLAEYNKNATQKVMIVSRSSGRINQELIGNSDAIIQVRKQILRAGKHTQHVLLQGKTGTGKSLAARLIHNYSTLGQRRFVTLACGSVTGTLFESELYGHVKGAFTGALNNRKGLWQEARGGTLFLDEIGDMPLDQQAKILVAIGRNKIRPVGSDNDVMVNARLIFATNRDLWAMVQQGTFREDLFYRIRYITIMMPALSEQKDSIKYIAQKFWSKIKKSSKDPDLSDEILDRIEQVNWTGNVRSLKAVLNHLYYWNLDKQIKDLKDLNTALGEMHMNTTQPCSNCEPENLENEVDMHRIKCLRHLKNTEEWVRSCQKIFEPLTNNSANPDGVQLLDKRLLKNRLEQINQLITEPLLFYKEDSFIFIHQLQGKMVYFSELIEKQMWPQAQKYLDTELNAHLNKTQTLFFGSIQALMG